MEKTTHTTPNAKEETYRIPPTGAVMTKSTGNWELDKLRFFVQPNVQDPANPTKEPYCAHFTPAQDEFTPGFFTGPDDAFLWFGQPHCGDPWITHITNPNNPKDVIQIEPRVDRAKIPDMIGSVSVEWLAWDNSTGCNVFRRLN